MIVRADLTHVATLPVMSACILWRAMTTRSCQITSKMAKHLTYELKHAKLFSMFFIEFSRFKALKFCIDLMAHRIFFIFL